MRNFSLNKQSNINDDFSQIIMNLQFLNTDKKIKSYTFASVDTWSNATKVTAQLAIKWAEYGKSILLVDADLRNPKLHDLFNIEKSPGLTDSLFDISHFEKYINQSNFKGVSVLSSGRPAPNPMELLSSYNMSSLIDNLGKSFDVILFNLPVLSKYSDGKLMALNTDQIVLLSKFDKTRENEFNSMVKFFQNATKTKPYVIGIK